MAGLVPAIHVLLAAKTWMPSEVGLARLPHDTCRKSGKPRLAATSAGMTAKSTALVRHPQGVQVGIENLLLLAAFVGVELAEAHDRAQGLGIEAGAFRL